MKYHQCLKPSLRPEDEQSRLGIYLVYKEHIDLGKIKKGNVKSTNKRLSNN